MDGMSEWMDGMSEWMDGMSEWNGWNERMEWNECVYYALCVLAMRL